MLDTALVRHIASVMIPSMTNIELRAAREKLKKTPREMAEKLGVAKRTYLNYEKGMRPIRGPFVLLLQRILDDHEKFNEPA